MIRTGIDLIEIHRLQETIQRHGQRFLERVFTETELAEANSRPASLAARFAAKEAVAKALGTGIGPVAWREIEIVYGPARQPLLNLHGAARQLASDLNLTAWSVSLSHTQTHAIAIAVGATE